MALQHPAEFTITVHQGPPRAASAGRQLLNVEKTTFVHDVREIRLVLPLARPAASRAAL